MRNSCQNLLRSLRFLLAPDADFVEWKFQEYRRPSAFIYIVCGIQLSLLWCWDWVVDPIGARHTLVLRLPFLLLVALGVTYLNAKRQRRLLAMLSSISALLAVVLYFAILMQLQTGMMWGAGGFMYCLLAEMVLFQCFSLALNLFIVVMLPLLPPVLALLFAVSEFPYAHYLILLGPATLLVLLVQITLACRVLDRYQMEVHLKELTYTDALTGVSNRRYFLPLLSQEITRCHRMGRTLSVLMLDIDNFKRVNDTYGHAIGDNVIRGTAEICRLFSRTMDTVGRLGGEEFAILLPEAGVENAGQVAERIRAALADTAFDDEHGGSFGITVSIGVAECQAKTCDDHCLLRRADAALLQAKKLGRNRVYVATGQGQLAEMENC